MSNAHEEANQATARGELSWSLMEQATKQAGFWSEALGGLTGTGVGAGLGGLAGGVLGGGEGAMGGALAGSYVPNLIGTLLAGTTPTRSTREQAEADPEVLKNLLIPGRAAYNQMKRLGMSIRSPELKQEQLNVSREKRDKNREEAKEASARGELSPVLLKKAIENVGVQQFVPLSDRREFSDKEKEDIDREKSHLLPKIFKSYKTPAVELLSSPGKQSLLAALLGGGLGAAGGALAGMDRGLYGGGEFGTGSAIGAGIGGLGLGGLAALLTYFGRKQRNEDVEDLMSRLPEGATRREMLSDPVYQRDLDRAHMAMMGGRSGGAQGGAAGMLAGLSQ